VQENDPIVGPEAPWRASSISPAIALPVKTGSSKRPSVCASQASASRLPGVTTP
jgi:hypothetical protein